MAYRFIKIIEVWVDKFLQKKETNSWRICNFVAQVAPTGFFLMAKHTIR